MTVRELIEELNELGEDNLDREVIMFDSAASYTPYKVMVLDSTWKSLEGSVLID